MHLCSVEHKLNTSSTFFSLKLDSPVIKKLERIRFSCNQNIGEVYIDSSNQNIGEGGSNFDEKKCRRNVQLIKGSFGKDILPIK